MKEGREIELVVIGNFINPIEEGRTIKINSNYLLAVNSNGFITHYESTTTLASLGLLNQLQIPTNSITRIKVLPEINLNLDAPSASFTRSNSFKCIKTSSNGFYLPGFIDTHLHAPQYLSLGTALDQPLMEWLINHTFKSEQRIDEDPYGLGEKVYKKLSERLIKGGTTGVCLFGTIGVEANMVLAKTFLTAGLRAQVGKVNMDLNSLPTYIETTASSLSSTLSFLSQMASLVSHLPPHLKLVEPILTPRFLPTCSKELLEGLIKIAKERNVRIQTHLSESRDQVDWSREMWEGRDDIDVFDELGLLTPSTLLAHCTHSTLSHLSLLSSRGSSISHCPLSNIYFSQEKKFPLREAWDAGLNVGLGSDVSGGYQVGLGEGMRWAVGVSRIRAGEEDERVFNSNSTSSTTSTTSSNPPPPTSSNKRITWKNSLYLSTLGGASAMGLSSSIGSFIPGKSFDAQWIEFGDESVGSNVDLFPSEFKEVGEEEEGEDKGLEERIEKWWCNGNESDRVAVWVQGRCLRMLDRGEGFMI